jgi:hypothetical protein
VFTDYLRGAAEVLLLALSLVSFFVAGVMVHESVRLRRRGKCTHEYMVEGIYIGQLCFWLGALCLIFIAAISGVL